MYFWAEVPHITNWQCVFPFDTYTFQNSLISSQHCRIMCHLTMRLCSEKYVMRCFCCEYRNVNVHTPRRQYNLRWYLYMLYFYTTGSAVGLSTCKWYAELWCYNGFEVTKQQDFSASLQPWETTIVYVLYCWPKHHYLVYDWILPFVINFEFNNFWTKIYYFILIKNYWFEYKKYSLK